MPHCSKYGNAYKKKKLFMLLGIIAVTIVLIICLVIILSTKQKENIPVNSDEISTNDLSQNNSAIISKEEQLRDAYFNDSFVSTVSYGSISIEKVVNNISLYEQANVCVYGDLVDYAFSEDGKNVTLILNDSGNLFMVKAISDEKSFLIGESICFWAKFIGIQSYDKYNNIPVFLQQAEPEYTSFTQYDIKKIAKSIFNKDFDVEVLIADFYGYTINYTNAAGENVKFRFYEYSNMGMVDMSYDGGINYYNVVFFDDYKKYCVSSKDSLNCYNVKGDLLWSKKYDDGNAVCVSYKMNNKNIYLCEDNKFYIIDAENGNNIIEPVYLKNDYNEIYTADEMIFIVTVTETNSILTAIDSDGTMLWETDILSNNTFIQCLKDSVFVEYWSDGGNFAAQKFDKKTGKIQYEAQYAEIG